jgi:hypothetical protein
LYPKTASARFECGSPVQQSGGFPIGMLSPTSATRAYYLVIIVNISRWINDAFNIIDTVRRVRPKVGEQVGHPSASQAYLSRNTNTTA